MLVTQVSSGIPELACGSGVVEVVCLILSLLVIVLVVVVQWSRFICCCCCWSRWFVVSGGDGDGGCHCFVLW